MSSGPELPASVRERLAELSTLEADWDSYGALRVSRRALGASGAIVGQVISRKGAGSAPQDIMPIADGGVALEWRYPRIELGLNACPDGGWSYLLVERSDGERQFTERDGLSDDEALALIFSVIEVADA